MSSIKLTWLRLNRTGQGYNIYRSNTTMDTNNMPEPYDTVGIEIGEYIDENVNFGDVWYYIVSSIDSEGNELFSDEFEILCKENFYVGNNNELRKYTYDGQHQWTFTNVSTIRNIDTDLDGGVFAYAGGSYVKLTGKGVPEVNVGAVNDAGFVSSDLFVLSDGRVFVGKSASSTSNISHRRSRNNAILYSNSISSDTIYRTSGSVTFENRTYLTFHEEKDIIVLSSGSNLNAFPLSTHSTSSVWRNSSQPSHAKGAMDSLGFLYTCTSGSDPVISKFYIDLDIEWEPTDPPLWQDSSITGDTISSMHTDRQGNLLVGCDNGKIVKYDTSGNVVFNNDLGYQIRDMKVQYNGDVMIATGTTTVLRVSGSDGSIKMEKDIDFEATTIAVDPGRTHIMRGSIIEF